MVSMNKRIVAIGDSLTYGFPFSPKYSWVAITANATGCELINKGICGETTYDILQRFEQDVVEMQPDYVIIMGGSNDAFEGAFPEEVVENIVSMLVIALKNNIIPIIGMPPPVNFSPQEELLQEYRKLIYDLTQKNNIHVINFYQVLLSKETGGLIQGFHNDGVHPNELGYLAMSQAATSFVASFILGE